MTSIVAWELNKRLRESLMVFQHKLESIGKLEGSTIGDDSKTRMVTQLLYQATDLQKLLDQTWNFGYELVVFSGTGLGVEVIQLGPHPVNLTHQVLMFRGQNANEFGARDYALPLAKITAIRVEVPEFAQSR